MSLLHILELREVERFVGLEMKSMNRENDLFGQRLFNWKMMFQLHGEEAQKQLRIVGVL